MEPPIEGATKGERSGAELPRIPFIAGATCLYHTAVTLGG